MRWLPVLLVVCGWLAVAQGARCAQAFAGATVRVAAGQSLQAAIDAAHPRDVLEIERGMYTGNLVINKPLTLRGLDRPTLSGGQRGDTIRISAPDVVIEGLIVRDSGDSLKDQNAGINILPGAHRAVVRQCELTYNLFGLWIEKANDVRIEANTITGKRDYNSAQRGNGVELYNTQGARIIGNNISFVRDALYVDVSHHAVFKGNRLHHSRYGTHYMNSYYNLWEDNDSYANRGGLALMEVRDQIVRNNRTWGNADHGIMLRTLQDSVVENNVVADNDRGFFIYDVEYTQLRGNLIVGNQVGVHLSAGSTRNVVQGNDFIGNREQVRYVGARDEAWGARTAAERRQGNFWSDYLGWDRDGDGIGDLPYEANDVVDRLIWRHPGVQLLLASPAVQALRFVSRQFPILRVPSVVDAYPRMQPANPHWSTWRDRSLSR
ncbi:putative ABC transporter binding protein NosD [Ralstonia edaphis]|uniref:ABC transporter binding protein NosD n=2 Tax=Pseudomonadota TaxID=1224 RepID=A0AB72X3R7_9RALS|nr:MULTISPECIES: nitrous oxide reductase family maturation protein NosD [unclassified Ralstonia]TXD62036.1 nitrous oxide reductase family maturation protein NosD [Ralstonia sp. TCR112]CAJ0707275.1 putative ABC transporter binding protein NosD [Ralstonia sp. LMG 6871]CAJ0737074.1 putative ABC transporter binding protein NosD [Ralstonia sp. LMG 6871]